MSRCFFIVVLISSSLLCANCGSSRKVVVEDAHSDNVAVVDSMAALSSVQSLLTNVSEREDLRIVIEEFDGGNVAQRDSVMSDNASAKTITRKITIERNKQRNEQSNSITQALDTTHVTKTDSVATDRHKEESTVADVNTTRFGVGECLFLFLLLFVAAVIAREYIYFRK